MTQTITPHTRLKCPPRARVGTPKPPEYHREAPPPRPLPEVSYSLRPRPLPIDGAFPPDQLRAMIDRMPDERHREIITLRYLHGYQWADIANTMAYDRTSIWRMHKAAIAQINQMVRQKIAAGPTVPKVRVMDTGWMGLAFVVGLTLMIVAWLVTDMVLFASETGQISRWIADVDKLRLWAIALWIGGPVVGWLARINYERMKESDQAQEQEEVE